MLIDFALKVDAPDLSALQEPQGDLLNLLPYRDGSVLHVGVLLLLIEVLSGEVEDVVDKVHQ